MFCLALFNQCKRLSLQGNNAKITSHINSDLIKSKMINVAAALTILETCSVFIIIVLNVFIIY